MYRSQAYREPCSECRAPSSGGCARCRLPHCASHWRRLCTACAAGLEVRLAALGCRPRLTRNRLLLWSALALLLAGGLASGGMPLFVVVPAALVCVGFGISAGHAELVAWGLRRRHCEREFLAGNAAPPCSAQIRD